MRRCVFPGTKLPDASVQRSNLTTALFTEQRVDERRTLCSEAVKLKYAPLPIERAGPLSAFRESSDLAV